MDDSLDKGSVSDESIDFFQDAKPFTFNVPPEAPVFEPTMEEFQDPMKYIHKIRPIAEKCGICKIKPPPDWQPPFSIDVENFTFTPRIQRLNELEAKTRIRLNFLDQIAKFWELQGSQLKLPIVGNHVLDLYTLNKLVEEGGGAAVLTKEKKWIDIAYQMNLPIQRGINTMLKNHYERILLPYNVFLNGKPLTKEDFKNTENDETDKDDKDYKPYKKIMKNRVKNDFSKESGSNAESSQSSGGEDAKDTENNNKELRRLQFYGAGPKMAGFSKKKQEDEEKSKNKTRGKKAVYDFDPLAKYVCHNCRRGDMEESMLLCDGCDDSYHMFCLMPRLLEIPKGDWRCPKCVAAEVNKPIEAFGFDQAQRAYTLHQFGEMADDFKNEYFKMEPHQVPTATVEREYWRIVSAIDEDVTVEYGADLHTMDHGSGFPTHLMFAESEENNEDHSQENSEAYLSVLKEYADSGWNLNNLPVLKDSILGHINADISGMKVPWMYVGMCFSTFCWHNEDHWSYSINYLHWGEPKTWYGVPGAKAEHFEKAMKDAAPELFNSQPDLLHQLVTIMNPNVIMNAGVPISRTDQHAGEFVITFPRAYHAGFNQGYNFAEAVNFAPADWLKMGRECISHYSNLHRFCVFSHDELVCNMATELDKLEQRTATATYYDMLQMVDSEKKMRKSLLEWGVYKAERLEFETLPDDERQCELCKTTCFLSAVTCSCIHDQLVCLRHYSSLCNCPPRNHTLKYRYSLDDLSTMLKNLKKRAETFDTWLDKVKTSLNGTIKSLSLEELKELVAEAKESDLPKCELLQNLAQSVAYAERCSTLARKLLAKVALAQKNGKPSSIKITVNELILFVDEINKLACAIKEEKDIKQLLKKVTDFQEDAKQLINDESCDASKIKDCIEVGIRLDIELEEIDKLNTKLEKVQWLEDVKIVKDHPEKVTSEFLRRLLNSSDSENAMTDLHFEIPKMKKLLQTIDDWEAQAKDCLSRKTKRSISDVENLLKEAESIKAVLPSKNALNDVVKKSKEWILKVETLWKAECYPYLDIVENIANKGESIPVHLDVLPELQQAILAAKTWKEKAARIFLKKNSLFSLMEVLCPRDDVGIHTYRINTRSLRDKNVHTRISPLGAKLTGNISPDTVRKAFKEAQDNELKIIYQLRVKNVTKRTNDNAESGSDTTYCICNQSASTSMTECCLCREWYHTACIPGLRKTNRGNSNIIKYICPCCLRTRRPRLESVLALLISLKKIPIRIPEGEALQNLAERAVDWLNKTRKLLRCDDMRAATIILAKQQEYIKNSECSDKSSNNKENPTNSKTQTVNDNSGITNEKGDSDIQTITETSKGVEKPESGIQTVTDNKESPGFNIQIVSDHRKNKENPVEFATHSSNKSDTNETKSVNSENQSCSDKSCEIENPKINVPNSTSGNVKCNEIKETPDTIIESTNGESSQHMGNCESGDSCNNEINDKEKAKQLKIKSTNSISDGCLKKEVNSEIKSGNINEKNETQINLDLTTKIVTSDAECEIVPKPTKRQTSDSDSVVSTELPTKKQKLDEDSEVQVIEVLPLKKDNIVDAQLKQSLRTKNDDEILKDASFVMVDDDVEKLYLYVPDAMRLNLKTLITEGDLMEVTVDESEKLWKILQLLPPQYTFTEKSVAPPKKKRKIEYLNDDTEEVCAAAKCLHTSGNEIVDWVQCDGGCEQWFHMHCVGLDKTEVNEDEDYICKQCLPPTNELETNDSKEKEDKEKNVSEKAKEQENKADEEKNAEVDMEHIEDEEENIEDEEENIEDEEENIEDEEENIEDEEENIEDQEEDMDDDEEIVEDNEENMEDEEEAAEVDMVDPNEELAEAVSTIEQEEDTTTK